ncbi:cyclopropane-fatty-acyl-phospholipid synthase family protein [Sphingomonas sp. CARO-RG-8B-R24-01]|uniref:SAM-dependent methyltransferase n=1 Tax=Sphingomonas sp. CARO-RG-8B-R24-01 TaxID=2914831 RepID=UPI001F55F3C1|nr:cyclopropane-fatty-acyl-phospholipid synthase family protein [Sphingomonas sp. CARO-RG-8B-R24-01]
MFGVFAKPFNAVLDRIDAGLVEGSLAATLPGGRNRLLGGRAPGPAAVVDLVSWRALLRLVTGGSAGWYVAWSKGEWTSPDPTVLFELFMRNRISLGGTARSGGMIRRVRGWRNGLRRNSRAGSRRNIHFHYDLGNDFYSLWLDPSMMYSAALFDEAAMTTENLTAAQARKNVAILDRLELTPGQTVLEIGCGWGGFAEAAARRGVRVDAITLSSEQERAVNDRIADAGLSGVTVSRTDYRDVTGQYDGIASIEMVEAVGQDYWGTYLAAVARALKPGGRAAIQYITIDDAIFEAYAANVDFIQRFVFPGGMLLSESRFRALARSHGLAWQDKRSFGLHYAETLRRWRIAFDAAVDAGRLPAKFDSKFINLWRYYLMYCEGGFRGQGIDVAQVTLVKV